MQTCGTASTTHFFFKSFLSNVTRGQVEEDACSKRARVDIAFARSCADGGFSRPIAGLMWVSVGTLEVDRCGAPFRFVNGSNPRLAPPAGTKPRPEDHGEIRWNVRVANADDDLFLGSSLLVDSSVAIRLVQTNCRSVSLRGGRFCLARCCVCPWMPRALWQSRW